MPDHEKPTRYIISQIVLPTNANTGDLINMPGEDRNNQLDRAVEEAERVGDKRAQKQRADLVEQIMSLADQRIMYLANSIAHLVVSGFMSLEDMEEAVKLGTELAKKRIAIKESEHARYIQSE